MLVKPRPTVVVTQILCGSSYCALPKAGGWSRG